MSEFFWTDETVLAFAKAYRGAQPGKFGDWERDLMGAFKASKQPKPEWEILAYMDVSCISDLPAAILTKDNTAWNRAAIRSYPIHSVKRLSDGEVFTVGQRRLDKNRGCFHITAFEIVGYEMRVTGPDGSQIGLDRMLCRKDEPDQMPSAANGKVPVWLTPEDAGGCRAIRNGAASTESNGGQAVQRSTAPCFSFTTQHRKAREDSGPLY
jgi:hypothetical protein